jgi:hypothetical protein
MKIIKQAALALAVAAFALCAATAACAASFFALIYAPGPAWGRVCR